MPDRRERLPRWSVRVRILAWILTVTAAGMAVVGGATYSLQRERSIVAIDELLVDRVESARFVVTGESSATPGDETIAAAPAPVTYASGSAALEAVLSRILPGRNESSLGIVGGRATYIPGVAMDFHLEDDPAFIERIVAEVADGSARIGTATSPLGVLRYIAVPITIDSDPEPAIFVTAIDLEAELAELSSSFLTFAVFSVGALLVVGLVGWLVAGRLLAPIRQLRATASRITATDLHERIEVVGRDDVSDLTVTINGMLERIEGSVTAQRQLLDDVRHELKTPLTIVQGHLELMDTSNRADAEATRLLALDELERMVVLVDDIDALADSQGALLTALPEDVADLTHDVHAKAAAIPDRDWILGAVAQAIVHIDRRRITQAWLQLVDNAAKYSPAGTPIAIGSSITTEGVEFWVSDQGPGIPAGAEARIFERFGRADEGRGIRGSGLGLPIVAAIARAHGGRVSVSSSPLGSRFAIVVPAPDPIEEDDTP